MSESFDCPAAPVTEILDRSPEVTDSVNDLPVDQMGENPPIPPGTILTLHEGGLTVNVQDWNLADFMRSFLPAPKPWILRCDTCECFIEATADPKYREMVHHCGVRMDRCVCDEDYCLEWATGTFTFACGTSDGGPFSLPVICEAIEARCGKHGGR